MAKLPSPQDHQRRTVLGRVGLTPVCSTFDRSHEAKSIIVMDPGRWSLSWAIIRTLAMMMSLISAEAQPSLSAWNAECGMDVICRWFVVKIAPSLLLWHIYKSSRLTGWTDQHHNIRTFHSFLFLLWCVIPRFGIFQFSHLTVLRADRRPMFPAFM